jgi:hydrogenase nickel incorporation protein HypB
MFRQCDVALLNKTDLLPHLTFDAQLATDNIQQVHPGIPVWPISATSGEGFAPWIAWLTEQIAHKQG